MVSSRLIVTVNADGREAPLDAVEAEQLLVESLAEKWRTYGL